MSEEIESAQDLAEAWAKAENDHAYAADIVSKASSQLERCIAIRKVAKAKLDGLLSAQGDVKLISLKDGSFVYLEREYNAVVAKVLQPEPPAEQIWEHT